MTTEASRGLAGRLAHAFITSPLSPLILLAMLGLGVMGLLLAPRQEDPQISVPMVDIFLRNRSDPLADSVRIDGFRSSTHPTTPCFFVGWVERSETHRGTGAGRV